MAQHRRKAPRQQAPQTMEEARSQAARYIELLDTIDRVKLDALTARDRIDAARDEVVKPLEEEAKALFRQLRPWWAANRDELTDGKRKSILLAGAQIGERTTTPALSLPKGMSLARFVEILQLKRLKSLLRIKPSLDKPACVRALRSLEIEDVGTHATDADHITHSLQQGLGRELVELGATVTQKDEFFIDRAPAKASEATEDVEVESEGAAA